MGIFPDEHTRNIGSILKKAGRQILIPGHAHPGSWQGTGPTRANWGGREPVQSTGARCSGRSMGLSPTMFSLALMSVKCRLLLCCARPPCLQATFQFLVTVCLCVSLSVFLCPTIRLWTQGRWRSLKKEKNAHGHTLLPHPVPLWVCNSWTVWVWACERQTGVEVATGRHQHAGGHSNKLPALRRQEGARKRKIEY